MADDTGFADVAAPTPAPAGAGVTGSGATGATAATGASGASRASGRNIRALPLNLFAIPPGLGGVGGAWAAAATLFGAVAWPSGILFALSLVIWAVFSLVYVTQGFRGKSFRSD